MKNLLLKKNFLIVFIVVILVLGGGYFFLNRGKKPTYDFVTVTRADLKQEVSVTGKVKPAEMIELAFETGGRVRRIRLRIHARLVRRRLYRPVDVPSRIGKQLLRNEPGPRVAAHRERSRRLESRSVHHPHERLRMVSVERHAELCQLAG